MPAKLGEEGQDFINK